MLEDEPNMTAFIIEALLFYNEHKDYDFKEENIPYKELFYQAFEAMTSGSKAQMTPGLNPSPVIQATPSNEEKEPDKEIDELPTEEDVDGFLDGLAAFDELG